MEGKEPATLDETSFNKPWLQAVGRLIEALI